MDTVKGGSAADEPAASWPIPPSDCPSRTVLDVLANKWVIYVLAALRKAGRPMRFNELGRTMGGITQKMLTQTLRTLERDGLVLRTVYPTMPPRVEYALTPLGAKAAQLSSVIGEWSFVHANEILAARDDFDERAAVDPQPVR
jgi:DNA-binding HxlR family transcriptional regulator